MINNKFLIFFFCFFNFFSAENHAQQNFLTYHDLVNSAEEEFVVKNNKEACYRYYDEAFRTFDNAFLKDYFSASQIAYSQGDTARFLNYLQNAFNAGMTIVCLEKAPIFRTINSNVVLLNQINKNYENRKVKKVNNALKDSVYRRFHLMELAKDEWANDLNKKKIYDDMELSNTNYYISFLEKGQFPSEQLIGIHTDENFADFLNRYNLKARNPFGGISGLSLGKPIPEDYELWNSFAYVSFLHYPCAFERTKNLFWKAVQNGFLHPKDYAFLVEWSMSSIGNSNYVNDCSIEKADSYFNIYSRMKRNEPEMIVKVEENRKSRHIQKYSVDIQKKKLEREKGFAFFFRFMHHR